MVDQPTITNADDDRLVGLITAARQRVIFVAPAVSVPTATALVEAWKRLGTNCVRAILDPDPEVLRLGYGTIDGLEKLADAARFIPGGLLQHPGVRIGLLIADDTTLVYSPAPLLVEREAIDPDRPNAILLGAVPADVAAATGLADGQDLDIGGGPITTHTVDAVKQDLAAAPPVKFDLARRVRYFTTRFQFVELEMTGCSISRRKVAIPSALVGLTRNRDVEHQFHAHYDLVQKGRLQVKTGDRTISERTLSEKRRQLESDYLIQLKGFGSVVLRANKQRFETAVEELRADVKRFAAGVEAALEEQMKVSQSALVEALLPAVKNSPPTAYTKLHGPHPPDEFLRERLSQDIARAFGSAEGLVKAMEVRLLFKDVTYESLGDPKFIDVARVAMPGLDALHEEHDAIPAQAKLEFE